MDSSGFISFLGLVKFAFGSEWVYVTAADVHLSDHTKKLVAILNTFGIIVEKQLSLNK